MPGRIIVLYVILCLRCLTNGTVLVKTFPPGSPAAGFTSSIAMTEFSACLFMLIALYQRKSWVTLLFRIYIAIAMPLSLLIMAAAAMVKQRNGEAFAWNAFAGGVIAAIGFGVFAWYVARGPSRDYLRSAVKHSAEPPLLVTKEAPNQSPTAPSGRGSF
jgi:hypothetical protein